MVGQSIFKRKHQNFLLHFRFLILFKHKNAVLRKPLSRVSTVMAIIWKKPKKYLRPSLQHAKHSREHVAKWPINSEDLLWALPAVSTEVFICCLNIKICKKKLPADKNNEIRSACCPPCLHICQAFSVYFLKVLQFNQTWKKWRNMWTKYQSMEVYPPCSVSMMWGPFSCS